MPKKPKNTGNNTSLNAPDVAPSAAALSKLVPGKPQNVNATPFDGKARITWNPVKGARSYVVMRRLVKGPANVPASVKTPLIVISPSVSPSSTLPDGKVYFEDPEPLNFKYGEYYYAVCASNANGKSAPIEAHLSPHPIKTLPPTGAHISTGNLEVTLSWTKADDDICFPIKGYRIYRNGVVIANETVLTGDKYTYTDNTGLHANQNYDYKLCAWSDCGESDLIPFFPNNITLHVSPTELISLVPGDKSIGLKWRSVERSTGYRPKIMDNGVYKNITASPVLPIGNNGIIKHLDTNNPDRPQGLHPLENGRPYTYTVTALIDSDESNIAVPKTCIPGLPPASITVTAYNKRILVSWDPAADASYYELLRHSNGLKETIKRDSTGWIQPNKYLDSLDGQGLTNGNQYYYTVRSKFRIRDGNSFIENPSEGSTDSSPIAPLTPVFNSLRALEVGNRVIKITWNSLPCFMTYYVLRLGTDIDRSFLSSGNLSQGITNYCIKKIELPEHNEGDLLIETPLTFEDTSVSNGKVYDYYIIAEDKKGNILTQLVSNCLYALIPRISNPQGFKVSSNSAYMTLKWKSVPNANAYLIYKTEYPSSTMWPEKIELIRDYHPDFVKESDKVWINPLVINVDASNQPEEYTYYDDKFNLPNSAKSYLYKIVAVENNAPENVRMSTGVIAPTDASTNAYLPIALKYFENGLRVTSNSGKVELSWNLITPNTNSPYPAAAFNIVIESLDEQHLSKQSSPYTLNDSLNDNFPDNFFTNNIQNGVFGYKCIINGLDNYKKYFFAIKLQDIWTNVISSVPRMQPASGIRFQPSPGSNSITIIWKHVNAVKTYKVLRYPAPPGAELIRPIGSTVRYGVVGTKEVPATMRENTELFIHDTGGLAANTTYSYIVACIDSANNQTVYSLKQDISY